MVDSYLQALRDVQDREFDREGIPMVLALQSVIASVPEATQPGVRADGARLAELVQGAHTALAPTQLDADLGVLISTLQAATKIDFERTRP